MARLPEYLTDAIDLLEDSSLEIAEKLAYKAHGGLYIEALFDASLSTTVGLISEEVDWQPMQLQFHGGDLAYSYDPEVSDVPFYCKHSGLNAFHGYVSEPPIAPAFRESAPVGLAAPALRALGTMEALLEHEGREDEIPFLRDYFTTLWGADRTVIENTQYLKPDIGARSDIDLLKSLRSKSHRLYGYENEQNYISVSMGNYTQGTISERRYVDWHRLNIILRFIGLFLIATDPQGVEHLRSRNEVLQYGIVAREFPLVVKCPHSPSFKNFPAGQRVEFLNSALTVTMRYYSSKHVQTAISHSLMVMQSKVKVAPGFHMDDTSIAILRNALSTDKKSIHLSFESKPTKDYDIETPSSLAQGKSRRAALNTVAIHHQISVRRAAELYMMMKLHGHWNGPGTVILRQTFDRCKKDEGRSLEFKMQNARAIITFLGRNSGDDIWLLMQRFRRDISEAQTDFIRFCLSMVSDARQIQSKTLPSLWWDCIRDQEAYDKLKSIYISAWNRYAHNMNHPSIPRFPLDAKLREHHELPDMVLHLWQKKRNYWVGHYRQRRDEWSNFIRTNQYVVPEILQVKKGELIRYQWLVRWLMNYRPKIQDQLSVWPDIENSKACELLNNTMMRFTRKRKDLALHPLPNENYKTYANRLDNHLQPKITFTQLIQEVHRVAKEITGDIAYLFRRILEPELSAESDESLEDIWRKELERVYFDEEKWVEVSRTVTDGWNDYDEDNCLPQDDLIAMVHLETAAKAHMRVDNLLVPQKMSIAVQPEIHAEEEEGEGEQMIELEPEFEENFDELDFDEGSDPVLDISSLSIDTMSLVTMLQYRNPIAEVLERYARIPPLDIWAAAANVTVDQLSKAESQTAELIVEKGLELIRLNTLVPQEVKEGYDIQ